MSAARWQSAGVVRARVIRAILVLVVFCAGVAYGFVADRQRLFPFGPVRDLYFTAVEGGWIDRTQGRWRVMAAGLREPELTDAEREELSKVAALGYLSGVKPAGGDVGVTVYDRDLSYGGLSFVVSGHRPEAWLMDMDGEVLHSWACDFRSVWPDWKEARGRLGAEYWGFAHLCENGELLAVYNWLGLVKLDKNSNVLWSHDGGSHHDLFVTEEGTIYAVDMEDRVIPGFAEGRSVWDNFITVLSSDGEVQRRVSIVEAFIRSEYAPVLSRTRVHWDVLHTNTVEVLDGRFEHVLPAFKKGNVLVSFRTLDTIAVIDLEAETIVWALTGKWRAQHQPTLLESGRLLLFNNIAGVEVSEVIEFDPLTHEVLWSYKGDATAPFFTREQGRNQRLPNGNTLITESDNGRAFEVTPERTIVWEYVNPNRAGADDELIAAIPVMLRLPSGLPLEWLDADD